ncbi:MAG: hypothetical protein WEF86_08590 [Gemmatimonadota bacterium]
MQDIRSRYETVQAARNGDSRAQDRIWQDQLEPLRGAVRRALVLERGEATETGVLQLISRLRQRYLAELSDKPSDWSTYDWLSWMARSEVFADGAQATTRTGQDAPRSHPVAVPAARYGR